MINGRGEIGYTSEELIEKLRQNPNMNLEGVFVQDDQLHNSAVDALCVNLSKINQWYDHEFDEDWYKEQQKFWLMPQYYQDIDIESLLLSRCDNDDEKARMLMELAEFKNRDLYIMLKYILYLVETVKAAKLVLGVGRGSSVASFALYKLGLHRVDSLKYELPLSEFLK